MFNFKKINKNKNSDKRMTLDAKHNNMVKYFKNLEKNLPKLKKKFKDLVDQFKSLDKNDSSINYKGDDIKYKLVELRKQIKSIENKDEQVKYYLNVGNFLHNYHEIKKKNKKTIKEFSLNSVKRKNKYNKEEDNLIIDENCLDIENLVLPENIYENNKKYKSVLEFFNNRDKKVDDKKNISFTNTKISNFITTKSGFKRANLLNDYLKKVDKNYIPKFIINNNYNKCKNCNIEMTLHSSDGFQICPKCHIQERVLVESEKPSFKDPPPEVSYFAYKRMNHFNECLAQFQGKESTDVPQEVYDRLILEIKKERIVNLATLEYFKIRKYLKKLRLNKYYEHIPHILNRINGLPPPILSKQLEEKLRLMFKEIQNPFREVCPKGRKNFLSYSYILHKFVELLGLDEFKNCFPLLKDRDKLHQTDMIWKNICKKLGWEFIKSI